MGAIPLVLFYPGSYNGLELYPLIWTAQKWQQPTTTELSSWCHTHLSTEIYTAAVACF
jgi:hypothetical protein